MAEHQGNSNPLNQGPSRSFFMGFGRSQTTSSNQEKGLPFAVDGHRRSDKLSFRPQTFQFADQSTNNYQPPHATIQRPSQLISPRTNTTPVVPDDRINSSSGGRKITPRPNRIGFTQDVFKQPDKARFCPQERTKFRERFSMCQSMQSTGKLRVSPEQKVYDFTSEDLQDLGEIGCGAFGTVNKMVHNPSSTVMAVKRIRSTVEEKEQKQLLVELEAVMKSNACPCIVQFYGALFKEGDCWICMELMDTSLDKFYKFIYERLQLRVPEHILGKIAVATVTALNYLKEHLTIIHRDVKPSNILLDRRGNIKLCDFGISGELVDSIARTRDAGCRPYMAPERIDPHGGLGGYDVRSDVWSLGITLMEVATGRFPYRRWNSVFEQLCEVVQGDPPRLQPGAFSSDFVDFVNTCLIKEEDKRPKYNKLLEHPFIVRNDRANVNISGYVSEVLDRMEHSGASMFTIHA